MFVTLPVDEKNERILVAVLSMVSSGGNQEKSIRPTRRNARMLRLVFRNIPPFELGNSDPVVYRYLWLS